MQDKNYVEDIVQETFLKLHSIQKKGVFVENERAWLYKVMINQIRNYEKSLNHLRNKQLPRGTEEQNTIDPHEDFLQKEKRAIVFNLLDSLSERERNLLILYNNGLKYKEIAEILSIKPSSVGTLLARSMEKIRKLVNENYNELHR